MGIFAPRKSKVPASEMTPLVSGESTGSGYDDDDCGGYMRYYNIARAKAAELYLMLAPFSVDLLMPVMVGWVLCFWGGGFYTLIAAVEAYQLVGYESSLLALNKIRTALCIVYEKEKESVARDYEAGRTWDKVEDKKSYVLEKTMVAAGAVDIEDLDTAMKSLLQGFFAVVATLQQRFCMAVTLGKSIGGMLEKPAVKFLLPFINTLFPGIPANFKQYEERAMKYFVNVFAITMAFTLQTYVSTVQAAMRGGLMISRGIMSYAVHMGWMGDINHEDTVIDEVAGYALAMWGIYSQFYWQFQLPFPLNIIFWPASVAQNCLVWSMGLQ